MKKTRKRWRKKSRWKKTRKNQKLTALEQEIINHMRIEAVRSYLKFREEYSLVVRLVASPRCLREDRTGTHATRSVSPRFLGSDFRGKVRRDAFWARQRLYEACLLKYSQLHHTHTQKKKKESVGEKGTKNFSSKNFRRLQKEKKKNENQKKKKKKRNQKKKKKNETKKKQKNCFFCLFLFFFFFFFFFFFWFSGFCFLFLGFSLKKKRKEKKSRRIERKAKTNRWQFALVFCVHASSNTLNTNTQREPIADFASSKSTCPTLAAQKAPFSPKK